MNRKKTTDPLKAAHEEAEKDILKDPELSDSDPTDDLDEGELAQRDNSDEEGFDELEKKRPASPSHTTAPDTPHRDPGKDKEK